MDRVTRALIAGRQAERMTQAQLADHLGVHYTSISQIERGLRPLPREWYARLPEAIAYRVVLAEIATLLELLPRD
jgi:transcriptional regulator with XRE-family HTH domain